MSPGLLLCCVGAGIALSKKRRRSSGPTHPPPLVPPKRKRRRGLAQTGFRCEPMPFLAGRVDEATVGMLEDGWDPEDSFGLIVAVMTAVYDRTPDGRPLTWPDDIDACPEASALFHRVQLRVYAVLADFFDVRAQEDWDEAGGT